MRYGMTEALGPMVYAENEGEVFLGRSVTKTTNMSEETMQKVDAEVRRIIDEQYALARKLIEDNRTRCTPWPRPCWNGKPSTASSSTTSWPASEPRPPKDWTPRTPPQVAAAGRWHPGRATDPAPTAA
jgi:cell division protease FtsH